MDELYPRGPTDVPPELTRPSAAYRRHAYLAVAGLALFVVAYFALAGWFAWTAIRLLTTATRARDAWWLLGLGGAGAGFLAVFMLKAVIPARRKDGDERAHELTADQHPRLFAFLHRLADEARAPRPHRVFVSPRVNAAVFYDLSLANLIIPSRKNLEIGLGLINVLTLGELKAVLAHEFGHFAQRSMAVGRWVYTAQQIAGHVVVKRDKLDEALQVLSTIDLRVAWIGWILRTIVWSIRSLVDTAFGWVVLAQRALSREMELQADLVAVSLTGSDALVHALHRLEAADDAMDRALAFTAGELRAGRAVADVFAIQRRMLERKRAILDDPTYGEVPPLPADPARHRVFAAQLAHPPRMWATHPPSELREANAKRVYVAAPLDDRPGWLLFEDPDALRAEVSARLTAHVEPPPAPAPLADSLARVDQAFDRRFFDPAYRGVYLGRSAVRDARTAADLYGPPPDGDLTAALAGLYPATLAAELARVRELGAEKAALEALRAGLLEAPGRVVRFRGQDRKRKELPGLVVEVDRELATARAAIGDHDRRVRAVHLAAARARSPAWEAYLRGLAAAVHYADHAEADLADAAGHLDNVVAVVTADRKVTARELDRVVEAGTVLWHALDAVYGDAADVVLGDRLAARLEIESWSADLGELRLGAPVASNVGDWLDAAQTWVRAATSSLSALHDAALEELLRAEDEVAAAARAGAALAEPPAPPRVPASYRVLLPGQERPRQERLGWWDRFQVADGFLPGAARFVVAGAIVGAVLLASGLTADATVIVYNGLARPVTVEVGGERLHVPARRHRELDVAARATHAVVAYTEDGREIERFRASVDDELGRYVYNVAGAAPLVEATYTVAAGDRGAPRHHARRWFATEVDRFHDEPPAQVEGTGSSVTVLASLADLHPTLAVLELGDDAQAAVAEAQARWAPSHSRDLASWLYLVPAPRRAEVIGDRLARDPDDVIARRVEQDDGGPAVCDHHVATAAARPTDATWQYLAARCRRELVDGPAFAEAAARDPDSPWLAYARAGAELEAGRWAEAAGRLERVRPRLPELREPIALLLARLRRVVADGDARLDELVADAPTLQLVAILEGATRPEHPGMAGLWALGQGQLADAAAAIAGDDDALLLHVAASDGAPAELVARALATPASRVSPRLAPVAAALAARAGGDPAPYLARLADDGKDGARLRAFLDALVTARAPGAADAHLAGASLEARARAYAAAAVLLGEACPSAWRELARRALFVGERPFLRAS